MSVKPKSMFPEGVELGMVSKEVANETIQEWEKQNQLRQQKASRRLFEAAKELGVLPVPKTDYGKPEFDVVTGQMKTAQQKFADNLSQNMSGDNYTNYLQTEIQKKLKEDEAYHQEIINFDAVAAEDEIAELEKKLANMPSVNWDVRGNVGQANAQSNANAINEIKAQIAEKKTVLNQKKRLQELLKNNDIAVNDPNYDKYVKTGKEMPWKDVGKGIGTSGNGMVTRTTYDDLGAAAWALYLHNNPSAKKDFFDDLGNADIFLEQMKDEEFDLLAYYIGKDKETGGNQAETYVELMKETLQNRKGQEIYEQYLKDNTVLEVLYGVPAGLDQFANGVTSLFNFKDDYIPASPVQVAGSLAREDLGDAGFSMPEWLGGASLGQMAYDSVQTTANMAPSIAASYLIGLINPVAGTVIGAALMGGSAAGNAYQEALNNGWGKAEARTYSTLIGASEALLSATISKVFGGKLVSEAVENAIKGVTNGAARFALNYGAAFFGEGLEEAAQEILSPLFENIAFGYNRKGFDDIDWAEVAYSFLLGGLSGGMFETVGSGVKQISSVASVMKEYNTPQKTQNLLKLALSFPTESNANKLATKYNTQVKTNGKLSANKVYNLVVATENVVTERLTKLGETQNVPAIASAVVKAVTTGQLTAKEKNVLSSSRHGAELLNEINVIEEAETPVLQSNANEDNSGLQSSAEGGITAQENLDNDNVIDSSKNDSDNLDNDVVNLDNDVANSNNDSSKLGFREPDTKEIYRKSTEKDFDILTGKRKNAAQRQMEAVAEKFGIKIGYKDDITKGYYDPALKTIYMNPVWSLTEQYFVLFKHELAHHLENYKAYDSFKRYVVNFSNSFDAYVRDRLKDELGEEFKGSRKEALKAYNDIVLKQRQASKEIPDRIKKSYNPESIEREIVADFVGEVMLGGKDAAKAEAALMEIAKTEHRTLLEKIRDWVNEWVSIIKGEPQNRTLAEDLEYLNRRIARVLDSKEIKKSTTQSGVVKFDIAVLENGNTYVKASRNVIKGETISDQRSDITNFFKKLLKNKPSIDIHTIEGDVLTLTMADTADKARDNYKLVNGQPIKMSDDEFAIKLRIESHLDEIAETSLKNNKPLTPDEKQHDFAKDGFEYRTAYFEDFDGKYYKIRFSIGHNGTIATVYNVGKIKEDVPPSAKLIAVVGSQALDGTSSNDIILNEEDSVKNNISREGEKYSSDNANSKHSVASEAFSQKLAELTEDVKSGKIGVDEFAKQVNDLAMNEHRIGEELMRALTEQEKLAKDFQEGAKRAEKLRDKIIMRQNKELMRRRSDLRQEIESDREMYADRLTNLNCIRRSIKRIDSKLRANTNDKHVPEHLKLLANEVVSLFVANDTTPFKRSQLEKIKAFYDRGLNSKKADDAFIAAYDPEISENFEKLSELIEGKKLRDLDWLESTRVRTLVEHVEYLINSGNETFAAGKKWEMDEIGICAISRLVEQDTKLRVVGTQQIEAGIKYANMTPIYFFDRVGGVLKELFNDIVVGQDKWYRNVELGMAYIRNVKEKYRYSEWKDKTIEFKTEDGESIELTVEQAMLLYATAQREYRDKTKQTNHLLKGGIVIEAQPLSIKAITTKLKDGKGKDAFLEEVNSRAHRITEGDIKKVFGLLSDEQIAYADAMVEYLSNDMAALGNEVSMKLHGIRKYTSEYYIPYNSAANFLNMQMGVTNDARLKHQSFTEAVSEGAATPLVLSNITEVCADHINRMSMYHALTIPLDAMERVLNYQIPGKENDGTESGTAGKSVASEIARIYGESATNYLKTFINDMNGTVRRSSNETIMNSMISKFKKGAVLASASVTIQQPAAIMRSMAYIDPKYFIKTALKTAEMDYQQLMQYAPGVAGIKAMGRFDTGTGVSTVKWMIREEPKSFTQKAKAFVDLKDSTYRDDVLSWTAAKADEITWAYIWAAVKAEVADKTTLKPGTEEFLKACGRRFTQVINYTQVYDSTLSRSQIMRDKSTAATMMTAFMSEPTVSLNLLMDAVYQAQKGTKKSKKFAARAVAAFVGNVLLTTALKSIVTAARDDDEDETYLEKYLSAFMGNSSSDMNLLNLIPYIKDIVSTFEGYTVERADMSLFNDLAKSSESLGNDNKTPLEKIENFSGALAAFLGLPVKNVIRDMKAAWNVIDMAFISKPKGDLQGAIFAVTGTEGSERYEALAEAAEKGNDAEYQRIYKHLIDSGYNDEDIKTNVQKFYREDKDVVKQTETYMKELASNKTYQGFDNESKEKIKSNIAGILAKEKTVEALVREPDRFDKLYEAKRNSKSEYEKLKKEMLAEGMSESLIKSGEEIAKVAYMKSIGIDIKEYYLFKMAMSEKYADTDSSGGLSKKEKEDAAKKLDIDTKAKQWLMKN